MTNRYSGRCEVCGSTVQAQAGICERKGARFVVRHLVCDKGEAGVVTVSTSSGWSGIRNARGICEDAPCCGCCTF